MGVPSFPAQLSFLGRDTEMSRVVASLNQVSRGQGRTLFVTGEAGIGKSRLLQELGAVARRRRFTLLAGSADLLNSELAYAPILEAFGDYLDGLSKDRRARIASELPQLGLLFQQLSVTPVPPTIDPSIAKTRLYDGVARLLSTMAKERPVALLFDDLHWADTTTLELIQFIARGAGRHRILLVCAFRASELGSLPALQSLVTSLHRLGNAQELMLQRFDRDVTGELVRSLLKAPPPPGLLDVLESHALGIPFFVDSILRFLVEQGALRYTGRTWEFQLQRANLIPNDLKMLILDRLQGLNASARRVLDLIAVLGESSSHALVVHTSELPEVEILDAVARLRSAGLLREHTEKGSVYYSLTHPLVAEVAYHETPIAARQHVHVRAIHWMEQDEAVDIERLARHYKGAGSAVSQETAAAVCFRAGKRARDRYAAHEAKRNFEAALTLHQGGFGGVDGSSLLEFLGEAYERTGDLMGAMQRWEEGVAHAIRRGDLEVQVRLYRHLARIYLYQGRFADAEASLRSGIRLENGNEPEELATLYFTWLSILGHSGEWAQAEEFAQKIARLAEEYPSPRMRAMSSVAQSQQYRITMRFQESLPILDAGYREAVASKDHDLIQVACLNLSGTLCVLGDHKQALRYARQGVTDARRIGVRPVPCTELYLSYTYLLQGNVNEALQCALEYVDVSRRSSEQLAPSLGICALVLTRMGRLDEAAQYIHEARLSAAGSAISDAELEFIYLPQAALASERGDFEEALRTARAFVDSRWFGTFPVLGWFLLGRAQLATGNRDAAIETSATMSAFDGGTSHFAVGLGSLLRGMIVAETPENESAVGHFEE